MLLGLTLFWIPSHVGIVGNDKADDLAKIGTTRQQVEVMSSWELSEELAYIDTYVQQIWQASYSSESAGSFYREIEPIVSTRIKYQSQSRSKERLMTRLRLGKCKLHSYLHAVGCHADGLCSDCHMPETIQHVLLECRHSDIPTKLIDVCARLNIQPTIVNVLGDNRILDTTHSL